MPSNNRRRLLAGDRWHDVEHELVDATFVQERLRARCSRARRSNVYSIFRSVTVIDGSQCLPSSERSWRAVSVFLSSLKTPVQRTRSPCQIHVPSRYDSVSVMMFPWLSKKHVRYWPVAGSQPMTSKLCLQHDRSLRQSSSLTWCGMNFSASRSSADD